MFTKINKEKSLGLLEFTTTTTHSFLCSFEGAGVGFGVLTTGWQSFGVT